MSKAKNPTLRNLFQAVYKIDYVLSFIMALLLGFFAIVGVAVFIGENHARVSMLQSVFANFVASAILFIPVHKTMDLKNLKLYYFLHLFAYALTMGYIKYTVYAVISAFILAKFFILVLRMVAIMKLNNRKGEILKYMVLGPLVAVLFAFMFSTIYSSLSRMYGDVAVPSTKNQGR